MTEGVSQRVVAVGSVQVSNRLPFMVIAGPCVVESESITMLIAERMRAVTDELKIPFVFKASFDKANRTAAGAFRGIGMGPALEVLAKVRRTFGVPVITDVHEATPLDEVAEVVDALQTPAFLVRQTDFIQRVARAGRPVNVKKGQFQAPWDMGPVLEKCRAAGNDDIMLCERGASFGYNTLVSDMRGLPIMRRTGHPVIFDATHSVQQPGGLGHASGGQSVFVPTLARAAVAAGVAGVFMETHPDPANALSDGPNMWPLSRMGELLKTLRGIDEVAKATPFLEEEI